MGKKEGEMRWKRRRQSDRGGDTEERRGVAVKIEEEEESELIFSVFSSVSIAAATSKTYTQQFIV